MYKKSCMRRRVVSAFSITIAIIASFTSLSRSQELHFWVRSKGEMNCSVQTGGSYVQKKCNRDGGCIHNPSGGQLYCCNAGGADPCWGPKQDCNTQVSPTGSPDQAYCRLNEITWCCNIVQENCVSNGFSSNGCWMKIPNPLRNESNDTYTTVKNMTLTGPTSVGTSVITSTGVQETASTTRSSGGGVSTAADSGSGVGDGTSDAGVIGGATTGGLVLGLIVAGVIWLLRRHSRKKALISQPVQYGEQKEGDNWYYGYGTRQPCELADESVGPRELPAHGTNVEVPS